VRYDQKCILVFILSTLYSCPIIVKLELSGYFRKNTQISNLINIRPEGAELLHVDRRTDRWTDTTKLKVAFRNFAKAHNNGKAIPLQAWTSPDNSRRMRVPDFKTIGT